jgi:hypothetical protein
MRSTIALSVALLVVAAHDHVVAHAPGASALVHMTITVAELPGAATECAGDDACVAPGALTIATEPWSQVYADGELIGTTPLWRHRLLPGRHRLRLANRAAGFAVERDIDIPSARMVKVRARFDAPAPVGQSARDDEELARDCGRDLLTPAYLSANSQPWTQVWVDGVLAGTTPLYRHRIAPGTHEIRLVNVNDGAEVRRTVLARAGQTTKLFPARPVARDRGLARAKPTR